MFSIIVRRLLTSAMTRPHHQSDGCVALQVRQCTLVQIAPSSRSEFRGPLPATAGAGLRYWGTPSQDAPPCCFTSSTSSSARQCSVMEAILRELELALAQKAVHVCDTTAKLLRRSAWREHHPAAGSWCNRAARFALFLLAFALVLLVFDAVGVCSADDFLRHNNNLPIYASPRCQKLATTAHGEVPKEVGLASATEAGRRLRYSAMLTFAPPYVKRRARRTFALLFFL